MRKSLFAGVVLMFVGSLGAQAASYTYFGNACGGDNPRGISLYNVGLPRIGTSFTVKGGFIGWVPNSGSYQHLLVTGASRTNWNGLPLPFSGLGCAIRVSVDVVQPSQWSGNHAFQVPNITALIGSEFYQQFVMIWHPLGWCNPCPPVLFWTSRGGHGVIGR